MDKEYKFPIVTPNYITLLKVTILASYTCYLAYTEKGDEIAAACNITDARAAALTLSHIKMPCGVSALQIAAHEDRLAVIIDRVSKDDNFRAYRDYRRVTK